MTVRTTSGTIDNLRLEHSRQNTLFDGAQDVAQGAAVVMAGVGMASAAVQTSMNADAFGEDVTIYTFELNGETYQGYCWEVTFAEGDEVTVAYQVYDQGFRPPTKLQVADKEVKVRDCLALIRPSTRSIWVMPHIWAGSVATKKEAIRSWFRESSLFVLLAVTIFALVLTFYSANDNSSFSKIEMFGIAALGSIIICYTFNAWVVASNYKPIFELAKIADEIFLAFAFDDPLNFDLIKTSEKHKKLHNIPVSVKTRFLLWY